MHVWAGARLNISGWMKSLRQSDGRRVGSAEAADAAQQADPLHRPQLALQGISPAARTQLLSCSLAALEQQIACLPEQLIRFVFGTQPLYLSWDLRIHSQLAAEYMSWRY